MVSLLVGTPDRPLLEKSREFLAYIRENLAAEVRFDENEANLYIDNRLVIKSVPAKILWKMVCIALTEGRMDFEYNEFINDPSIIFNKRAHNIPKRITRMIADIPRKTDCPSLKRTGRGRVQLLLHRKCTLA